RLGVQLLREVVAGKRHREQPVVEAHRGIARVLRRDPMNRALDLAPRLPGPTARLGIVATAKLNDIPRRILDDALALHDVCVAQPYLATGLQAVELAGRVFHEVVALDEDPARERPLAQARLGPVRMFRGLEPLLLAF